SIGGVRRAARRGDGRSRRRYVGVLVHVQEVAGRRRDGRGRLLRRTVDDKYAAALFEQCDDVGPLQRAVDHDARPLREARHRAERHRVELGTRHLDGRLGDDVDARRREDASNQVVALDAATRGLARRLQHVQQRADVHRVELALPHAHAPPALAIVLAPRPLVDHRVGRQLVTAHRADAVPAQPLHDAVLVEQVAAGEARRELARHVVLEADRAALVVLRQVVGGDADDGDPFQRARRRRRRALLRRRRRRRGLRHLLRRLVQGLLEPHVARAAVRHLHAARRARRAPLRLVAAPVGAAAASREPGQHFSGSLVLLSGAPELTLRLWLWLASWSLLLVSRYTL
ncbi:unnamed protein product, partial [Pelagomonas calceolata]